MGYLRCLKRAALCPIEYFIGSPTYNLSKFLIEVLKSLTEDSSRSVRNSRDFVTDVRTQQLDDDDVMVSFDVISLFTNVPTGLAIDYVEARLKEDCNLESRTSSLVEDIIVLLRFCLNQTYFSFANTIYHQIEGCPMEIPVSVTVANLVMEHVETRVLNSVPFLVKMCCRYVDDTFTILERINLDAFHVGLNSVHHAIQFTYETERNNVLPLLDVLVRRARNGSVETTVYRKQCDTGIFLSFDSHHPTEHKRFVVRTFLSRCDVVCSNKQLRLQEVENVVGALERRHYPRTFINDTQRRMQRGRGNESRVRATSIVSIPYVQGVSDAVQRTLRPMGVQTVFKPHYTLTNVFPKPKDRTSADGQSGVVCKVQCGDGDAKATHATRSKTELVEHCWTTGHSLDLDNAATLAREQRGG
ncbi:unnamed protein product, partial [Ixodes pacificus]